VLEQRAFHAQNDAAREQATSNYAELTLPSIIGALAKFAFLCNAFVQFAGMLDVIFKFTVALR
jgi:hypothetical protein